MTLVPRLFQAPLKLLDAIISHQGDSIEEPRELFQADQVPPGSLVKLLGFPK